MHSNETQLNRIDSKLPLNCKWDFMSIQPVRNLFWLIQMCFQFPCRIPNTKLNQLNQLANDWVLFRHKNDPINISQIFNWFGFDAIYKNKLMNESIHCVCTQHTLHTRAFNYRYKITSYWIAWWYQPRIQLAVAFDLISRWNWNDSFDGTNHQPMKITNNNKLFFYVFHLQKKAFWFIITNRLNS